MKVAELVQKLAKLPQDADLTFITQEENGNGYGRGFLYRDADFSEIMFELQPEESVQIATIFVKLGKVLDPEAEPDLHQLRPS